MTTYEEVLAALCAIERQVSGIRKVHTEEPESISETPCFINELIGGDVNTGSIIEIYYNVNAILIVNRADSKQSALVARGFLYPVIDKFGQNIKLGKTDVECFITKYDLSFIDVAGIIYRSVTFNLKIKVKGGYSPSVG